MGWFWSDDPSKGLNRQTTTTTTTKAPANMYEGDISLCPVMNPSGNTPPPTPPSQLSQSAPTTRMDEGDISLCPVMNPSGEGIKSGEKGDKNAMNPLNYIPKDVSATVKHPDQDMHLTTERTISTIPKGNENSKWEYPSAQQMYNAMVRKGKIDSTDKEEVDETAIESMVEVHNFLNESCWYEVLDWEKQYTEETNVQPKLLRFMGKPGVLSPRARLHYYMSYIFPSHFAKELPFDRHDWVILRGDPNSKDSEYPGYRRVRYVLDFYGGPDDPNGFPTFSVDVRPALDNIGNAKDRFEHLTKNVTNKYFGEKPSTEKK